VKLPPAAPRHTDSRSSQASLLPPYDPRHEVYYSSEKEKELGYGYYEGDEKLDGYWEGESVYDEAPQLGYAPGRRDERREWRESRYELEERWDEVDLRGGGGGNDRRR
jgi:hypothetical protein